ncbi:PREDICTED: uncharacterized protein LOC107162593, partial [Diuraphis noxia]|uniref:uncharacterized protein LOC107162593 n=1 Tax=Diuraphis noxia TaxID=143948 RepID=UPI000763B318
MSITGNNIFLLEAIVYRVTLTDQIQVQNTCPVCVCFQFPGLIDLMVCEGGFCADGVVGGGKVLMANGKSCLFTVDKADLCRTAREFRAIISVNRRVVGEQQMRYVAQTELVFDRMFVDILLNPYQDEKVRTLKRDLPLYEKGRPKPVGTVEVLVRLSSQGNLVVTHFNRSPNSDKYNYKPVNENVPTHVSAINCSESLTLKPKKICKHKATCKNKRPKTKQEPSSYCASKIKQANCIMTMMEKLATLYKQTKIKTPVSTDKLNQDKNQSHKGKQCLFNLNCPVDRCPFRTGKLTNDYVSNLIESNCPGKAVSCNKRSRKHEIVDNADLFVVNVGRVDPCRVVAPLVYKDGCTQCFETD